MFPLILLAFGVGAFAYGFSSRARSRMDDYARAIRAAHEAHRAADAQLSALAPAPVVNQPPAPALAPAPAANQQTASALTLASVANQRAAQSTADAGRLVQTEPELRAVADSATRVLERKRRIEEALASLGVGQCGVRSYGGVTPQIRDGSMIWKRIDPLLRGMIET